MTTNGILQLVLYLSALLLLAWPLGSYMASIYGKQQPSGVRWLLPVERSIYRLCGIREDE
ncbi:MAG: potassium-transporting ATPase subunit KdpA, partial [Magnetococcales bacterium]|nr:potassium-transporting ATPase subunit KdpA [Magnetococcales bacterium]